MLTELLDLAGKISHFGGEQLDLLPMLDDPFECGNRLAGPAFVGIGQQVVRIADPGIEQSAQFDGSRRHIRRAQFLARVEKSLTVRVERVAAAGGGVPCRFELGELGPGRFADLPGLGKLLVELFNRGLLGLKLTPFLLEFLLPFRSRRFNLRDDIRNLAGIEVPGIISGAFVQPGQRRNAPTRRGRPQPRHPGLPQRLGSEMILHDARHAVHAGVIAAPTRVIDRCIEPFLNFRPRLVEPGPIFSEHGVEFSLRRRQRNPRLRHVAGGLILLGRTQLTLEVRLEFADELPSRRFLKELPEGLVELRLKLRPRLEFRKLRGRQADGTGRVSRVGGGNEFGRSLEQFVGPDGLQAIGAQEPLGTFDMFADALVELGLRALQSLGRRVNRNRDDPHPNHRQNRRHLILHRRLLSIIDVDAGSARPGRHTHPSHPISMYCMELPMSTSRVRYCGPPRSSCGPQ